MYAIRSYYGLGLQPPQLIDPLTKAIEIGHDAALFIEQGKGISSHL